MFSNARSTRSASASYAIISLPLTCMETSEKSTARNGKAKSTSSPEAFPASLFPPPGEGEERKTTASSGRKCFDSFERRSQLGSSLRTCVAYLLSTTAWYSSACALRWKSRVTKYSRLSFQLAPWQRPTDATESGLLPTPKSQNANGPAIHGQGGMDLQSKIAMLPTLRASEGEKGGPNQRGSKGDKTVTSTIAMLPTPMAGSATWQWNGSRTGKTPTLRGVVGKTPGLKLQPAFAAWMMGFPENWTESPFLAGAGKA